MGKEPSLKSVESNHQDVLNLKRKVRAKESYRTIDDLEMKGVLVKEPVEPIYWNFGDSILESF